MASNADWKAPALPPGGNNSGDLGVAFFLVVFAFAMATLGYSFWTAATRPIQQANKCEVPAAERVRAGSMESSTTFAGEWQRSVCIRVAT